MSDKTESVLLPGDVVDLEYLSENKKKRVVIVGPGLSCSNSSHSDGTQQQSDKITSVTALKAGLLKKEGNTVYIDSKQKRYVPAKGDSVIGIVTARQSDIFRVDIGGSDLAIISFLSFEGASKKNRPDVKVGDLIFGKLLVASRYMEPELVCIESSGKSNGMGVIRDEGNLIHLPLHWTRRLLSKECTLLKMIGDSVPYETAIGVNGYMWVKARSVEETISICELIKDCEKISESSYKILVSRTLGKYSVHRKGG